MYINYMRWDVTDPVVTPAALERAYARGDVLITSNTPRLKHALYAELVLQTGHGEAVELISNEDEPKQPWDATVIALYHAMCKRVHIQLSRATLPAPARERCTRIFKAYDDLTSEPTLAIQRYHEFIGELCDALKLRGFMDSRTNVFFYSMSAAKGVLEQKRHDVGSVPMPMLKGSNGSCAELPLDAISRVGSIKIPAGTVMTTGNEKLYTYTQDTVPVYIADSSATQSSGSYRLLVDVDLIYPCVLYSNKQVDFMSFMSMSPRRILLIFIGDYPRSQITGDVKCIIRLPTNPDSVDAAMTVALHNPNGNNVSTGQSWPPAASVDPTGETDGEDDDSDDDEFHLAPEPPVVAQKTTKEPPERLTDHSISQKDVPPLGRKRRHSEDAQSGPQPEETSGI